MNPRADRAQPTPHLLGSAPAGRADAFILILHGGKPRSSRTYLPVLNASLLRMLPFDRDIRNRIHAHPDARDLTIGTHVLQYRVRGWNEPDRDSAADAVWAVDEIRRAHGDDTPIAVLGHSMGGRAAAHLVERRQDNVRSVFALAPWWPDLDGLRMEAASPTLRVLHGSIDPITSPKDSRRQTEHLAAAGVDARWFAVPSAGHYMFRQPSLWREMACEWIVDSAIELAQQRQHASE